MKNPFTLTFGKQPDMLISRYETIDKVVDVFQNTSLTQTYLIEGIRGSGKTVLMTTIAEKLKEDKDWIVVNLNPNLNLLDEFAKRLNNACLSIPDFKNTGFNISVGGIGIGVQGNDYLNDNISIIENILDQIKKKKKVLITIDEVLPDQNMKIFASQFQIFIRENYPLYLIMTGLVENIYKIQNDPSLTFLLRSPKIITEPLSLLQITRRYRDTFAIDEDKARELALLTNGYAFAFQALGAIFWDYKDFSKMKEILEKYDELLDDYAYKKIWESLTDNERKIVLAIDKENTKTSEICKKTSIKTNSISQYRESLIFKGVASSEKHGYLSLTLPRFYEVVKNYK